MIVDCGGFDLDRPGATTFLQLMTEHARAGSGSWAWYCDDAFLRRKLGRAVPDADVCRPIHASFPQAVGAVRGSRFATISHC